MRILAVSLASIIVLAGCGKHQNPVPETLGTAQLQAPAENELCTTGTILSPTLSTVQFSWMAAANAVSYEIVVKNLLTNDSTTQSISQLNSSNQVSLNIATSTPFSWYVLSKSSQSSKTTRSTTWKFYNSGPGLLSYVPFPAEIISPLFGQTVNGTSGMVDLVWKGSAVSQDTVKNYDVYFGTNSTPPVYASGITNSYLDNVVVSPSTIYYWKVITRDNYNNSSDSGVFQFVVN